MLSLHTASFRGSCEPPLQEYWVGLNILTLQEDGAGAQLLVYDGLQHEEGVEQLDQGAELLADPSYNYQYYIIDRTGIQRVTLLWVMNVDYFLQDMSTDCKTHDKSSTVVCMLLF